MLDQRGQLQQRFLPPVVAHLGGNHRGNPLLHDVHLGATHHLSEGDSHLHLTWKIGVIKDVQVADLLVRRQFNESRPE